MSSVTLSIYNITGQKVAQPLADDTYGAGVHSLVLDASGLSSGIYFYRLKIGNNLLMRKMMLLK